MKILQVANGFPPVDRGGVETYTLWLSQTLQAEGHEVSVFCREAGDDRPVYSQRDDVVEGIPVRRVTNRFNPGVPLAPRYYDPHIETLFARWVEERGGDVIHFQHTNGLSASLPRRADGMGCSYVMTLHDYWYMCPQVNLLRPDGSLCTGSHRDVNCYECLFRRSFPPLGLNTPDFSVPEPTVVAPVEHRPLGLSDRLYRPLQRTLPWSVRRTLLDIYDWARIRFLPRMRGLSAAARQADRAALHTRAHYMREMLNQCYALIVPSQIVRTLYTDFGLSEDRVQVIPHGMNMSIWKGFQPSARPLGSGLRFGYIGSLLRHKGVDLIVRVLRQLDYPDISLWLHGFALPNDPFASLLHELADGDSRIRFEGPYAPAELPSILNQMDVLLIPSRWHETFSLVTREAVLAGLPVIASRMGGIPEVIEDGVNGILLPSDDAAAWTAAMSRMIKSPELVTVFHCSQLSHRVKTMREHAAELVLLYTQAQSRGVT